MVVARRHLERDLLVSQAGFACAGESLKDGECPHDSFSTQLTVKSRALQVRLATGHSSYGVDLIE